MRRLSPFLTLSRGIRRRGGPTPPPDFPPQTTTGTSAGILDEAATFSDVHTVVLNPTTRLPYPERELRDHLEKSSREVLKEKNKAKYGTSKKKSSDVVFDHIPLEEQMFLLFPGQGAQFVGMGKKVVDCPASKRLFEEANEYLGYNLTKICHEGPSTKLDQTLYCQPAVFVSSLAALEKLKEQQGGSEAVDRITHVAGFSVGEYAAMVAGGMLSFSDALKIVKIRAEAMHECNQLVASGMMTVKVNASSRLEDAMQAARQKAREASEMEVCEIANFLFCGVRVVGASQLCMDFLEEYQQDYNFQVVKRLAVSGAFHTRQMDSAVEKVRKAVQEVKLQPARCNVYSNFTGSIFPARKAEIRQAIFKQVNSPVKWEQIQQLLYRKHQDFTFPRFIEVGPGRQLGAMLLQTSKKAYKNYEHFSC